MSEVSPTLAVRVAGAEDASALANLSTQLGYPTDPVAIAARLGRIRDDAKAGEVFVAVGAHGVVLGWTHVSMRINLEEEPFAELAGLVVDDVARGGGVGKALLCAAEEWARRRGCKRQRVRSNVIRERAHGFYLREGYTECKRQVVFDKLLC